MQEALTLLLFITAAPAVLCTLLLIYITARTQW